MAHRKRSRRGKRSRWHRRLEPITSRKAGGITMSQPAPSARNHVFHKEHPWHPLPVKDVARAVAFYTRHLGLVEHQQLRHSRASLGTPDPAERSGRIGIAADAGWSTARGRRMEPVVLRVADLPGCIAALRTPGLTSGTNGNRPGGRQIQIEDPDGNPIELFEPARPEAGPANGRRVSVLQKFSQRHWLRWLRVRAPHDAFRIPSKL